MIRFSLRVELAELLSAFVVMLSIVLGSVSQQVSLEEFRGKVDVSGYDVIVNTKQGVLRGKRRRGDTDAGGVTSLVDWFLGVPYAEPPVGDLRFRAPKPLGGWPGTRNATRMPPFCPQTVDDVLVNEDCLYLNIYSPIRQDEPNATYPVLFFIHGGSYAGGSGSSYLGHILAQYGVVVVTINYRLGILGFLSARDPLLPGNYGLQDQIEALRWVQANIRSFRGDPSKVSLTGCSAGGASVGLITISPSARGLFQQAIIQSGSPLSFWAMHNATVDLWKHAHQIAEAFGCTQTSLKEMVACMRAEDWGHFAQPPHIPRITPVGTNLRPCVDGTTLPYEAQEALRAGAASVDLRALMIGVVQREWTENLGLMFYELDIDMEQVQDGMQRSQFEQIVRHVFGTRFWLDDGVVDLVLHQYTNWSSCDNQVENRRLYCELVTDLSMVSPSVQAATLYHDRQLPVYMYSFDHPVPDDWGESWRIQGHGIELQYLFAGPFHGYDVVHEVLKNYTKRGDKEISRRMMKMWSDFAKFGAPTGDSGAVQWNQYQPNTTDYLYIHRDDTRMRTHLKPDKVSFWNELVPRMRDRLNTSSMARGASKMEVWILVAICMVLLALLLASLGILCRKQNRQNTQHNPVPVRL